MSVEPGNDLRLEIGHVLFIDLVGYSKIADRRAKGAALATDRDRARDFAGARIDERTTREAAHRRWDGAGLSQQLGGAGPLCARDRGGAEAASGDSGADGNSQRTGERSDRRGWAHQSCRGRDQPGAAGDGLRRCRAHPPLAAGGGGSHAVSAMGAASARSRRMRSEARRSPSPRESLRRAARQCGVAGEIPEQHGNSKRGGDSPTRATGAPFSRPGRRVCHSRRRRSPARDFISSHIDQRRRYLLRPSQCRRRPPQ